MSYGFGGLQKVNITVMSKNMKTDKKYGFIVLFVIHSLVTLILYFIGEESVIPSYIFAAALTTFITQSLMKKAFYFYWGRIPVSQKVVIFLLPSLLALSSRELSGLFVFSFGTYWFYSFYAIYSEKQSSA
jgi:hypothetical protein